MHTAIKITLRIESGEEVEKTVVIPNSEFLVLSLLGQERMTAPQLSRKSVDAISKATTYTLCKRLVARGLLVKTEIGIPLGDLYATQKYCDLYISRKYYSPTYIKMEGLK